MSEEGWDEKSAGSEALSLLSYTLRYVSLADLADSASLGCDNRCTCDMRSEEGGRREQEFLFFLCCSSPENTSDALSVSYEGNGGT